MGMRQKSATQAAGVASWAGGVSEKWSEYSTFLSVGERGSEGSVFVAMVGDGLGGEG